MIDVIRRAPVLRSLALVFAATFGLAAVGSQGTSERAGGDYFKSNTVETGSFSLAAKVFTAAGWVPPGSEYPIVLTYTAGDAPVAAATVEVVLHSSAVYLSSNPAPTSGDGTASNPLRYSIAAVEAGGSGQLIISARAMTLEEDPEVFWKDISSAVTVEVAGSPSVTARTHGPKVTTLPTARYGDRPFPVVMVEYQDVTHCTGAGEPFPECLSNHTSEALDEAVNSQETGASLWQLYQDMSFGQLHPIGEVSPAPGAGSVPFDVNYPHKFSEMSPNGTCTGTTLATSPTFPSNADNRVADGWYRLPGTQAYYGADSSGHALAGALTGQGLLFGIDDACGPTGKIVYDAASLADPDINYNDFDTDKDGVVDFFNLMFAGDGGNGNTTPSGLNNVWPHKSDLRAYFTDDDGLTGYVSNDQLISHFGEPLYYADATRAEFTTTDTGLPVYVRVGPYNVNPESAVDHVSVVGHEYGHSLGLPDFYSTGNRSTYGSWGLMASDHFQFMTGYARQRLGWIVPRPMEAGQFALRESKYDTGEIHWTRPDGTPYVLAGEGIHNANMYRLGLPTEILIDEVTSGIRAWYSGSGNDFGCAPAGGHNLDIFVPMLANYPDASAVMLRFQSQYEIEWDWDYGFVLVSADGGESWTSLTSEAPDGTTTINGYNPNQAGCFATYGNGITGVSGTGANVVANPDRLQDNYPASVWIQDQFDMTAYAGQNVILRFTYFTDAGLAKRGWFIDDVEITADDTVVYSSDFEEDEHSVIFPKNWTRVSTTDGVDTDHAYYLEMRDRIGFDFDSRGQSERGAPSWQPGVSMLYTDEQHGFGNTGVDNPPAQTLVDAAPTPGSDSPNLDDAAFTVSRSSFDGCTHVDNYSDPDGPEGNWKLPDAVKLNVLSVDGLSPDGVAPADAPTATVVLDVLPDCGLEILAPELAIADGYEEPDTDGRYTLSWTRPDGAVGPDTLQEATSFVRYIEDDAESGIGGWVSSIEGTAGLGWSTSTNKSNSGSTSFHGELLEGGAGGASLLTSAEAYAIPAEGSTTLSYYDFYMNESDDTVSLQVSVDDGTTWQTINQGSRSELANDAALLLAEEPLAYNAFSLDKYAGQTIRLRFRIEDSGDNRAGSTPLGWYVDDVVLENNNFADLTTVDSIEATVAGRATGSYFYRVKTEYPAGPITLSSPWSNVIQLDSVAEDPIADPDSPTPTTPTPVGGDEPPVTGGGAWNPWALFALLIPMLLVRRRRPGSDIH